MLNRNRYATLVSALALAGCATSAGGGGTSWPAPTLTGERPIVIAHRGASGLRPEHTLEGYRLAIMQGADCIEPDLVFTKDGVLVARHDTFLSATTDVADHPEFADRKRPSPDPEFAGKKVDWWVADFTLAELKTLRAKQLFPMRSKEFDGKFQIPTFDEVLDLAASSKTLSGKPVCVYPEAKSPAYHASLGMPMAGPILETLKKHGMDRAGSPVFIQSFEPLFVKEIAPMTELPVIMLAGTQADYDADMAVEGAPFWDGAGVTHPMVANPDGTSTGFIEKAHSQGIAVHVWTYRDDVPAPGGDVETRIRSALTLGLDGFFTDFPATGARVVYEFGEGE
ncbi:MAG: glycerophosphodiester phosphodiesterase family protein [Hyphomonadaceae bacterium]